MLIVLYRDLPALPEQLWVPHECLSPLRPPHRSCICCQRRWKLIHHSTSAALLLEPPVKQGIGSLHACLISCACLPLAHPPHDALCAHVPLDRVVSYTHLRSQIHLGSAYLMVPTNLL
jgi:hypothetical protein